MLVIDAHLHLDERIDGTVERAAKELDRQLEESGITRAIVLHLQTQPWSQVEFASAIKGYSRLVGFVNVHPYNDDCLAQLKDAVNILGYAGLKLHPRLQEFSIEDERVKKLVQFAGELGIPVLIDAFPDGTHLMQGFSPLAYAKLAKSCPETKIIIAHMGGHYVLDFMMLAKRLSNVYFDCSYSLLYYQGSSVSQNMVYAMKSMKYERIFYGSDYPDRSVGETLEKSLSYMREMGMTEVNIEKIVGLNARNFFG